MSSTHAGSGPARTRGVLEQLISPFVEVRPGEAATALLLMLNVFLVLLSYSIVKTVREPLIQAGGGAEVASYSAAAQALLLLFLVPAYGAFASRVNRVRLITGVTLCFISNLILFYVLARTGIPYVGVAFFIWVGIFNLMIVAQFWAFANDVYTPEQGKRLFVIVVFGSNLGAILGAWAAKVLARPLGVYQLMLVAAAILVLSIPLTRIVNARERRARGSLPRAPVAPTEQPLAPVGGFQLVFQNRYLLLIALLVLVSNFVNTNGEYILRRTLRAAVDHLVSAGQTEGLQAAEFRSLYIAEFSGDYQFWVNLVTAAVQLFLVSRVFKRVGVRGALLVLPLIALGSYSVIAAAPLLANVRIAKIFENSTDYSVQNTARQTLFLPTSREAKYKAKAAIDSLFWRAGDLCSAGLVFLGAQLAFTTPKFATANMALVVVWTALAVAIGRRNARLTASPTSSPSG